jgi:hypothetical protein
MQAESKIYQVFSSLFAFLALIISLCTLFLTFFWVDPDVRSIEGSSVQVSYVPKSSKLQVDLRATIANFGRQMDIVGWAQGELSSSAGSPTVYFSSRTGDITLKDAGHEVTFPFTVRENTAMDVDVQMSQMLGSTTKSGFFSPGQTDRVSRSQLLSVTFKTASNRNASARFCFELRDEVLAEIEKGVTKEFSAVKCGGG